MEISKNGRQEQLKKYIAENRFFDFLTGDNNSGMYFEGLDGLMYPCGRPVYTDLVLVMRTIAKSDIENIKELFEENIKLMIGKKGKYLLQVLEILHLQKKMEEKNTAGFKIDIDFYFKACCQEVENDKENLQKQIIEEYANQDLYKLCQNYIKIMNK